jgi:D-alanyl-lipoteichoic acid acyltransferase DltB (MBOAT superfamily)
MIYNSLQFIVLFPLIFLLYYAIPARCGKARNLFLLVVSYLLYLQWKPVYALILLGVTLVTYLAALSLECTQQRKALVTAGVILALLPLAFFKYFNFINDTVSQALAVAGLQFHLSGLNWAIPIGISFFTFQALGYLLDVHHKRIEAERDFLTYALFISFFPSILSGPINKASLVIPQLKRLRAQYDRPMVTAGLRMILWGMFMKVVVADRVALYVDTVLPNYMNYSGLSCFVASVLYTIQIYADFAGYSLMAIGVGKALGFELTENFRRPYLAVSVTDFWRRWHISLSTWLKDYIYIPLGGNRCSRLRCYWNIFVTFLVSGVWHGANWTFIMWGIMHGVCQIIEKMLGQQQCRYGSVGKTIKIVITFMIVNFAWIFFRMPTLGDACRVIGRIFDPSLPHSIFLPTHTDLLLMVMGVGLLFAKDILDEFFPKRCRLLGNRRAAVRWTASIITLVLILLCGVFGADQFIYAKF